MKTIIYTILLVITELSVIQAQYIPMRSYISTPGGRVPITTYYYNRMPNYYGKNISSTGPKYKSYKYFYEITLQNDSIIKKLSKIDIDDSLHFISLKVNGETKKYYPKDTKEIYTEDAGKKYTGIPSDSCWLFKIVTGNINCYAFLPEVNSACVVAFQYGDDGPIQALTKENLIPVVASNEQALNYAKKDRLLEAIKIFNKKK